MNDQERYLLFLLPEEDGSFVIRAVNYGKVPLDTNNLELYNVNEEADSDTLNKIYNEARQKY